jgi:uroporphyrinogen decarboxylase
LVTESDLFDPYIGKPDKNRFKAALLREPVDRVPNFETLIEDRHVEKILGRYAGNTLAYGGDPAKGAGNEFERPMYPGDYIEFCNIIGQDVMDFDGGQWTPFKRYNENGKLVQVADKSIKNRKDFNSLVLDSEAQINNTVKYIREYREVLKKENSNIGIAPAFGCLMQTLYEFVVGMNDFMMMVYEDPVLVEDMLEVSTDHFVKMAKAVIAEKADFIFVGDDIAFKTGLFLPPDIMKKIWVPRLARIFEPAVESGIPILFHSDGKIDDVVEDLIEMGVNCIHPMDPYGIDYRDYKKRFGGRLALAGNVDVEFPLSNGKPEDVREDVKKHMEVLKPGYGYVAACSHSIVNYIPHENYIAYVNAIHEFGKY